MLNIKDYIIEKFKISSDIKNINIDNIVTDKSIDADISSFLDILDDYDKETFINNIENNKIYEVSFYNDEELNYEKDIQSIDFKELTPNYRNRDLLEKFKIEFLGWLDGGNGLNTIYFEIFDGKHPCLYLLSTNLDVLNDYKDKLIKEGLVEADLSVYDLI